MTKPDRRMTKPDAPERVYRNRARRCDHGFYDGMCPVCHQVNAKTKQCTRCGFVKPRASFDANTATKDGKARACKSCMKWKDRVDEALSESLETAE